MSLHCWKWVILRLKSWSRPRIPLEWLTTDAKASGPPVLGWKTNNLYWWNISLRMVQSHRWHLATDSLWIMCFIWKRYFTFHRIWQYRAWHSSARNLYLFIFKTQGQILVCDRVKGDLKSFLLLKMCLKNGEWIPLAVALLSLRTDLRAYGEK